MKRIRRARPGSLIPSTLLLGLVALSLLVALRAPNDVARIAGPSGSHGGAAPAQETPDPTATGTLTPEGTTTPQGTATPQATGTPQGTATPQGTTTPDATATAAQSSPTPSPTPPPKPVYLPAAYLNGSARHVALPTATTVPTR